jgi:2-dehydro-3-deoxyphosphooctonate aldolase (KDO 8-P synthase)
MEVHEDPDNAPSDGPNMIKLKDLSAILETLKELDGIAKANPITIQ